MHRLKAHLQNTPMKLSCKPELTAESLGTMIYSFINLGFFDPISLNHILHLKLWNTAAAQGHTVFWKVC